MFNLEKEISEWRKQLADSGIKSQEVLDELESHLREGMERIKPELRDGAAFQAELKQLGDSKNLQREFAKVNRFRLWPLRGSPILLALLGIWFVLMGMNSFHFLWHSMVVFWTWKPYPGGIFAMGIHVLFALQILVGIGLLRRLKFCRYCALGFLLLTCYFLICKLQMILAIQVLPWWNNSNTDVFMGLSIPTRFVWIINVLDLCITIWGICYLAKPSVRDLFLANRKTKKANEVA